MHEKTHTKKTCNVCNCQFSLATIQNHLKTHNLHEQDYYICKLCPKKVEFTSYGSISNHLKKTHGITAEYLKHFTKETRDV